MAAKKIGALWLRTSRDGKKKFFSGVLNMGLLGDVEITVWKNDRKEEGSKQPDYNIMLSDVPSTTGNSKADTKSTDDDDIPF